METQGLPCTESPNETPGPPSSARLIVVDDHELLRESLRSMLECDHNLRIVEEAKNGQEAIEMCRLHYPDLVLMDVRMPKMNGLEATRTIKEELPTTKVLILGAYEDPGFVSEALRAGADGYVLKLSPVQELLDAIRGVLGGESHYPLISGNNPSRDCPKSLGRACNVALRLIERVLFGPFWTPYTG